MGKGFMSDFPPLNRENIWKSYGTLSHRHPYFDSESSAAYRFLKVAD